MPALDADLVDVAPLPCADGVAGSGPTVADVMISRPKTLPAHASVADVRALLADALTGIGHRDEAEALFTRLLGLRNDLGLLSEEYDAVAGRQLGNTPQAFSHVGLVNTARHLSGTRAASDTGAPAAGGDPAAPAGPGTAGRSAG